MLLEMSGTSLTLPSLSVCAYCDNHTASGEQSIRFAPGLELAVVMVFIFFKVMSHFKMIC